MNLDDICFNETPFVKHFNPYYVIYSIILISFGVVFAFAWILRRYTYFAKKKIPAGRIPEFPWGNFGGVIRGEENLHIFLWRQYNRFKKKGNEFGGLYLFVKPVIVIVDDELMKSVDKCVSLLPYHSKIKDFAKIVEILPDFLRNFNSSIKAERLLENASIRDIIFESVGLAFGLQPTDVNHLLHSKSVTKKYLLSLCLPFIRNANHGRLKGILSDIIDNRKKHDEAPKDIIQAFIDMYNDNVLSSEDLSREFFDMFCNSLTYTYTTTIFCLYELADNTDLQQEVIGEIRRFSKKHQIITLENLKELVFLHAVVKETLRKYPPVSTMIKSTSDFPSHINQKCLIFQSVLGIHRDPTNYTKPDMFDPDRFLEDPGINKDTFIPFGFRKSFYMDFIPLQVSLVLISIFSTLEVRVKDGVVKPLKFEQKEYLCPGDAVNLEFVRISD